MRWIIINLLNGLIATLPHLLVAGLIYQCPERVLIIVWFHFWVLSTGRTQVWCWSELLPYLCARHILTLRMCLVKVIVPSRFRKGLYYYTNICAFKIILMHTCTYVLWLALSRIYTMKVEIKVSLRAAKWLINLHETFMTDFKFRYLELWIWNTIIVLLLYLSVSSVFHVQNSSINCNQQLYQKLEVKCTLASCKYTLSSRFLIY